MNNPLAKAITEGDNTIVVLLPTADDEIMQCPLCTGVGRYAGKTRIENLARHIKANHPEQFILYRCWKCGFAPPEGTARYPRKVVTSHCSSCVPEILSEPAGREGAQRRANIRRQLRGTDAVIQPPPPATPRRNTRRGQPSPEPAVFKNTTHYKFARYLIITEMNARDIIKLDKHFKESRYIYITIISIVKSAGIIYQYHSEHFPEYNNLQLLPVSQNKFF